MELKIQDAETNIIYTLMVNEDDHSRAQNDVYFATKLLHNAIKQQNENLNEPSTSHHLSSSEAQSQQLTVNANISSAPAMVQTHHVWQYAETLALITSMQVHLEDLSHPKKKKYVYEHCANDLLSQGFSISAMQCQMKWKSLIRSYQSTKDQKTKTGRGPSRFQFFEEIDSILGTKPSNQCTHSIESSSVDLQTEQFDNNSCKENDKHNEEQINTCTKENEEILIPNKRKRGNFEEKKYIQEQKNKRHTERMEIEKQKMEIDKEKVSLLKAYLENKHTDTSN